VLYPIAMGVLSILLTWKLMLAVFGLSIVPWFWLRPSRAKIRVLTVMVIGPALAGFWSQGLYYLPNPPIHYLYQFPWTIAWLGSPGITTYGMVFGLEQTARVLVTVSTSMLILISTDVGDFTWAFERFGAPPQVGFALTAALRFMPEMLSRTTLVLRAVELRGYDLSRPHWYQFTKLPDYVKRLARCVVLVTVPLLISTLRGTTTMAMVADARGFGVSRKRGSLRVHRTTAVDVWGYAILIALVAGAFVLNHLHVGNRVYG
jgi:energy-coupling factor transport system permease protein